MSFVEDIATLVKASKHPLVQCPPGWPRTKLGSVAQIVNGYPLPSAGFNQTSGTPVARIRDVVRGRSETRFSGPTVPAPPVDDGDLLVGMDGDFNLGTWRGGRALLNQRVCKLVPDPAHLDTRFLAYVLPGYLKLINANTPSLTVKHLSSRTLSSVPLPLPPLDVQRCVADRIDELFSELDDGEEELRRARAELETYRKSLLKAAVTGELTADWRAANPPEESGAELLQRILTDRRARWEADPKNKGKRYKEPSAPVSNQAAEVPASWTWSSYEQCCTSVGDNGLKLKERDYLSEGKYPVIDQGSKPVAGYTDDETMVQHPDRAWILFGDHTRRFKFVDQPFCIGADGIKIIRPEARLSPHFMWRFFQGAHFEDRGYSRHFQFVRALNIPIPPREEQDKIVAVLGSLLAEAEELNELASAIGASESAALRQSILAAAFRGELVQ